MSNYIPLVEYKGIQIEVDTEVGKFRCYLDDRTQVEERTLSTVRKQIDKADAVALVLRYDTDRWVEARRSTYSQGELLSVIRRRGWDSKLKDQPLTDDMVVEGYGELDERIISEIEELNRMRASDENAIKDKYHQLKLEVIAQVVPLTYGKLRQLLAEDRKKKDARR